MTSFSADTNIFFYSVDTMDMRKHIIANICVAALQDRAAPIPLQSLTELYQSITRKRILSHVQAQSVVSRFASLLPIVQANKTDLTFAMARAVAGEMRFFDALLVGTASRIGCEVFLTEDMQTGQTFGGMRLVNPFLLSPAELDELLSAH